MGLRRLLEKDLNKKQIQSLRTSFDIIGTVAIIEIPEELGKKEMEVARAIMKLHPHVKTVLRKVGDRSGEYRLREMKTIVGNDTKTEVKEHGCTFRLDVKDVYFSPRESTERQRIASMVRPRETVMVMFSGISPYAITIVKKQPNVEKVYAVEINPAAHKYAVENIRINKVGGKVVPIEGDVTEQCMKYYGMCDRVIMPLPKEGHKFLPVALDCLKKKGTVHFYYICLKEDMFENAIDIAKMECKKRGKKMKVIGKRKILPYGPGTFKVCIDFEASNR